MNLGQATSNADAVTRVRTRLVDDVGQLLQLCHQQKFFPFWVVSRALFPIAESIAALLYGNTASGTSAQLSTFIRDDLGAIDARYKDLASTLCQVWRHGLTHHDEPPFLIARPASTSPLTFDKNTRSVSWRLSFHDPAEHMTFEAYAGQSIHFTFCLATFYEHLLAILDDKSKWSIFSGTEVMDRYNEWAVKILDDPTRNTESGRAANEIVTQLP